MGARPAFSLSVGSLTADTSAPVSGPSRFVVERNLELPLDGLRVSLTQGGDIAPGDPTTLDLGDEDGLERVFTGSVAEVRPRLGGCDLFCVGTLLALAELRISAFYQNQSAGAVARDLVGQAGLDEGEISDGLTLHRFAVERRSSAYFQLHRLAEKLGFSLFSNREGAVHFRGLGPAASLSAGSLAGIASSVLGMGASPGLEYGKHLLEASAALRPTFARTVLVGGESPMSGQGEDKSFWLTATDAAYEDTAGSGPELLVIDPSSRTKDMAARFAAGLAAGLNRRSADIRLTVLGMPALELGESLTVSGAPESGLNVSGYIKGLRHRFGSREGFLTDLVLSPEEAL